MEPFTACALAVVIGLVIGIWAGRRWRSDRDPFSRFSHGASAQAGNRGPAGPVAGAWARARGGGEGLPAASRFGADSDLHRVLAALRSGAVLLDPADAVVTANSRAMVLGLVRGHDMVHDDLFALARAVRRGEGAVQAELELTRGPVGQGILEASARGALLDRGHVLLLVEDQTQAKRVEEVRRDFVANVSHELKTPVGGIALLAEAILDASDDPEAVSRFAQRIRVESTRLSRLVQEIVDLSRLQGAHPSGDAEIVDVVDVVAEAVELTATLAEAHDIALTASLGEPVSVYGDASQLTTAVTNLLTNAVNYSAEGTRIGVAVCQVGGLAEITVTDQGCGIPEAEQARVFERFYRVDAARSRATGGTGLGLAIVKHICTNHGGDVKVWSRPGQGSTFTMRLPVATTAPARAATHSAGDHTGVR